MPEGINPGDLHAETALVPTAHESEAGNHPELAAPVARLPVELDVAVPVRDFRVRDLLALKPGQLIESEWGHGDDVPLSAGAVQLTWSEFEVVDTQLAVRITRLV
jgi:flagellar motor switch protein FliM